MVIENQLSDKVRGLRIRRQACVAATAAFVLCLCLLPSLRCAEAAGPIAGASLGEAIDPTGRIETKADRLDYDRKNGKIEARGHVIINKGTDELRADYVRVDLETEDADAFGNVVLRRTSGVWSGSRVHYNFRTKEASCDQFTLNVAPFKILGGEAKQTTTHTNNLYEVRDVTVTTCTNALSSDWHWQSSVRSMEAVPGEYFDAHGAVIRLGGVPVMYLPYWYRNLREDLGFQWMPGYGSDMGLFILTDTRYRLNPVLRADTEVDYRSQRGIGVGEGFDWNDPQGSWMGSLDTYFTSDKDPLDESDDPETSGITSDRYRVRLKHTDNLTDRDYILLQANYLSDSDILEDFFEDEYRDGVQPENYLVYAHREDQYTINALARVRLNDFYSNVNRLPEVSADFMRQQVGDTDVYYEGRTAGAFLQSVYADTETTTDYSVFRFDTSHMFSRPEKYRGFLNVSPRIGVRETYYSRTRDTQTTVTSTNSTSVDASGQTNVTAVTSTNTVDVEAGAQLRSRLELGAEVSYKAFVTWDSDGVPMRHVIEPYANYTLAPEPNLSPEDLYQFDEVDQLARDHSIKIGARNKIQTKRDNEPHNLVDIDAYARFLVETDPGQEVLDSVNIIGDLYPADTLHIRFDGQAAPKDGLQVFNSRLEAIKSQVWAGGFEYRYRKDDTSLVLADVTLFPKARWASNAYGRYEIEESRLEEVGGYLQRNYDCIACRFGLGFLPGYVRSDGIDVPDEWRIIFGLWLTAFPQEHVMSRHLK